MRKVLVLVATLLPLAGCVGPAWQATAGVNFSGGTTGYSYGGPQQSIVRVRNEYRNAYLNYIDPNQRVCTTLDFNGQWYDRVRIPCGPIGPRREAPAERGGYTQQGHE